MTRNAWAAKDARIKELEEQLASIHEDRIIGEFVKELAEGILLVLTQRAFSEWPPFARTAFHHYAERMPTAAALFKRRLPHD